MNTRTNTKDTKGFTIIEVVLVLAIAGLIFLMVFIALPALQRNQRDTQRRNDIARVQTAVNNYQTNNKNKLPSFDSTFVSQYLITSGGDDFADPSLGTYQFASAGATGNTFNVPATYNGSATNGTIYYALGYTCDGGSSVKRSGNVGNTARKVALVMALEGSGAYCVSN